MILILFLLVFASIWLPTYLRLLKQSDDKNSYIYGGRKSVSNIQLNVMRKRVNSKRSKF